MRDRSVYKLYWIDPLPPTKTLTAPDKYTCLILPARSLLLRLLPLVSKDMQGVWGNLYARLQQSRVQVRKQLFNYSSVWAIKKPAVDVFVGL